MDGESFNLLGEPGHKLSHAFGSWLFLILYFFTMLLSSPNVIHSIPHFLDFGKLFFKMVLVLFVPPYKYLLRV